MKSGLHVSVIGLGYIGLPTSALIASKKIKTTGIDTNGYVVDKVSRGEIHIAEPDLAGLVRYVVENKFLSVSAFPVPADVFMITVPTPILQDKNPDISFVKNSIESIIPVLADGNLIIIESTCPVNTTDEMKELVYKKRPELAGRLFISYCPERVLPGRILYELENNDRVIGGINPESTQKAVSFYSLFVKGALHPTSSVTAEMCKLIENSYRDVNIAFANELSILCDHLGIDVFELISLTNKHPRVNILKPSSGVGGHCIAVDPYFLSSPYPQFTRLISLSRELNNYKTQWVIEKIKNTSLEYLEKNNRSPKIALMGLAFKPDVDDLRESPSLIIAESLSESHDIIVSEPNISSYGGLALYEPYDAVDKADIIAFLVAHREFKNMNIPGAKTVLDFCNVTKE